LARYSLKAFLASFILALRSLRDRSLNSLMAVATDSLSGVPGLALVAGTGSEMVAAVAGRIVDKIIKTNNNRVVIFFILTDLFFGYQTGITGLSCGAIPRPNYSKMVVYAIQNLSTLC
jgi:hypothetical protein